jgi:hypothetical protein
MEPSLLAFASSIWDIIDVPEIFTVGALRVLCEFILLPSCFSLIADGENS